MSPLLEEVFQQLSYRVEGTLGHGSVGTGTLVDVGPRNLEEKVEAASRVRLVLDDWVEHRLVVSGINMPSGLRPDGLRVGPLEDIQLVEALGRLPVGNPWGKARQVVSLGLSAWGGP
jgi:hypothetical protein